jgi:predicted ATPase with chaperone activity
VPKGAEKRAGWSLYFPSTLPKNGSQSDNEITDALMVAIGKFEVD